MSIVYATESLCKMFAVMRLDVANYWRYVALCILCTYLCFCYLISFPVLEK